MSEPIIVPAVGDPPLPAIVARWLVEVGAQVRYGDALVELESEKVTFVVSALVDGVLAAILHPAGAQVHVGEVLGTIVRTGTPFIS